MILILYEGNAPGDANNVLRKNHSERAAALAVSINDPAMISEIGSRPVKVPGLDTIILWGHGDFVRLCGLRSQEVVNLIIEWKKLNSSLKTLEIITCNSGHAPTNFESFNRQVKDGLSALSFSTMRTRGIVVKALPVNFGGSTNGFSILLADANSRTWCYVSAHSETGRQQGSNAVRNAANQNHYNLVTGATIAARDENLRRNHNFSLNYGDFSNLRRNLALVG